jgi:uncharacterized membrane protein YebE (DUF533 family)
MNSTTKLLSDDTTRGLMLLGGVVAVGVVAYVIYSRQKSYELMHPEKPKIITVGVDLPQKPPRQ